MGVRRILREDILADCGKYRCKLLEALTERIESVNIYIFMHA